MPQKQETPKRCKGLCKPFGDLPRLFGKGARDRLLVCLAVNGPLRIQTIASLIEAHPSQVIDMVTQLVDCGLVMTCRSPGYSYAAISAWLPVRKELVALLRALNKVWRAPRRRNQRPKLQDDWQASHIVKYDKLFSSPNRSRVLRLVASRGYVAMETIRKELSIGSVQARRSLDYWERQGVLRSRCSPYFDNERFVRLNDEFVCAQQLAELLERVNICSAPRSESDVSTAPLA